MRKLVIFNSCFKKTLFVSLLLSLIACTQKREQEFPYGMGRDLYSIQEYDGKTFQVQTGEKKADHPYSLSNKNNVQFAFVNFSTNSDLLPTSIPFLALPKTKYDFIVKIEDKNFVIYKMGNEKSLHSDEKVSAEKITVNKKKVMAVPVVAYNISEFVRVEPSRNERNQSTHWLNEYRVMEKKDATHFRFDRANFRVLDLKLKSQILPSNFFQGTWYTSAVISKVPEENNTYLGFNTSVDSNWNETDKLVFVPTEHRIIGLNASYDERIQINSDQDRITHLKESISFPVKWVDYTRSDLKKPNHDEVLDENKSWKDKKYVEIKFEETVSAILSSLKENIKSAGVPPILSDLVVEEGYFMFSLQYPGAKITLSFLKDDNKIIKNGKTYQARRYFTQDSKYFGFFSTRKNSLGTYEKYRREDFDKYIFINRFNLDRFKEGNKRVIHFRLTDNSVNEPEMIKVVQNALREWTMAFHSAGLKDVEFVLDKERATLGDLRYNLISMVRTLTSSSLFGFGPSLADPSTGEIISATTNIHVTSIKGVMVDKLRTYIRHVRGELNKNYPLGPGKSNGIGGPSTQTLLTASTTNKTNKLKGYSIKNHQCDFANSAGNLVKDIESEPACRKLVELAKQGGTEGEVEALEMCAEKLLPQKVQATLIHEIGHNLGLRHNFRASTDIKNFPRKVDARGNLTNEFMARSSSVMEYTSFNEDRLTVAGPYDVEAIRFGYNSSIVLANNQSLKLKEDMSIDENLQRVGQNKKSYLFCTDEHVALGLDPLCQRHDSGSTPEEVVDSLISNYNTLFATQNYRYDRAKSPSPSSLEFYKKEYIFKNLKTIYDQWRVHLTEFIGEDNKNLSIYDENSYRQVLAQMSQDPKYGQYYKLYKPAADKIFDFLMTLLYTPSRYCVLEKDGKQQIVELTNLSQQVYVKHGIQEISCNETHTRDLIHQMGFNYQSEVGFYFNNQKRNVDMFLNAKEIMESNTDTPSQQDSLSNYYDVIGFKYDRDAALETLRSRDSSNYLVKVKKLEPAFLEEPIYRNKFVDKLADRILKGIESDDILKKPRHKNFDELNTQKVSLDLNAPTSDQYFEKWHEEKGFFVFLWSNFQLGVKDANNDALNAERSKRWLALKASESDKSTFENAFMSYQLPSGYYVYAKSAENDIAANFIRRLKYLLELRDSNPALYNLNKKEYDAQINIIGFALGVSVFGN